MNIGISTRIRKSRPEVTRAIRKRRLASQTPLSLSSSSVPFISAAGNPASGPVSSARNTQFDIRLSLAAADWTGSASDYTITNVKINNATTRRETRLSGTFTGDAAYNLSNVFYFVFDSGSSLDNVSIGSRSAYAAKHDGLGGTNTYTVTFDISVAGFSGSQTITSTALNLTDA